MNYLLEATRIKKEKEEKQQVEQNKAQPAVEFNDLEKKGKIKQTKQKKLKKQSQVSKSLSKQILPLSKFNLQLNQKLNKLLFFCKKLSKIKDEKILNNFYLNEINFIQKISKKIYFYEFEDDKIKDYFFLFKENQFVLNILPISLDYIQYHFNIIKNLSFKEKIKYKIGFQIFTYKKIEKLYENLFKVSNLTILKKQKENVFDLNFSINCFYCIFFQNASCTL